MDGHAALPSSPSMSLWRYSNARRIGADRDSERRKLFPIELREHKQPAAQQLSLPAQHLANPRAPSSPQMATSVNDGARQRQDSPQTATSAAMILDVANIQPTQPAKKGYGPPDKILGHPPVKHTGCHAGDGQDPASPRGTIRMCSKVHRVLDQHERVKWGQNESGKRKNARSTTQGRKRRWGFSEEKSLPIFGESDHKHKQMHFIGCSHSNHDRVC